MLRRESHVIIWKDSDTRLVASVGWRLPVSAYKQFDLFPPEMQGNRLLTAGHRNISAQARHNRDAKGLQVSAGHRS